MLFWIIVGFKFSSELAEMCGLLICSIFFQLDIHLILVSVDEQRIPSLQRPYLCCRPTLLVRQLCQVKLFFQHNLIVHLISVYYIS